MAAKADKAGGCPASSARPEGLPDSDRQASAASRAAGEDGDSSAVSSDSAVVGSAMDAFVSVAMVALRSNGEIDGGNSQSALRIYGCGGEQPIECRRAGGNGGIEGERDCGKVELHRKML